MDRPFRPILRNPHLLTIAGNFWPREMDAALFPARRQLYETDHETQILVVEHQPPREARGQIIFLHGLEGSGEAGYIKSFAQAALLRGFGVHRSNMRTCGGTESLSSTMYHSGLTSDTRFIVEQLANRQIGPVFLVGFSLGGNVALKLAGELADQGAQSPLAGVVSVSAPIDLAACVRTLDRRANYIYARRFLKRLKERIQRKALLSPHLYSAEGLDQIRSIWEFDDRYTGPLFGFGNADNYYRTQSARNFLGRISIPTLLIQAKDDPLIPVSTYNHPAFDENPWLRLRLVDSGGHLGFLSRDKPRFWLDHLALDWIESLAKVEKRTDEMAGTKPGTITSL